MQAANSSSIWINASNAKKRQGFTKVSRAQGVAFKYIFFLILLAFICSLFYIWSRIQVVNIGYDINRSLALKEKLIEENKKLTLEAATLRSPVRLETMAHQSFKMDLPQKNQILNRWVAPKEIAEVKAAKVVTKTPAKIPAKVVSRPADPKAKSVEKSKKENNLKTAKKVESKSVLKVASVSAVSPKR